MKAITTGPTGQRDSTDADAPGRRPTNATAPPAQRPIRPRGATYRRRWSVGASDRIAP